MLRTRIRVCIAVAATTALFFGASVDAQIGTRYYKSYQPSSNQTNMWDIYGINPYTKTTTANSRYCYRPVTIRTCQIVSPQSQVQLAPANEELYFGSPVVNQPTPVDGAETAGAQSVIEAPPTDPHIEIDGAIETDPSQPSLSDIQFEPAQPNLTDPSGTQVTQPVPAVDEKAQLEKQLDELRNRIRATRERSRAAEQNSRLAIEKLNDQLLKAQNETEAVKQKLQKLEAEKSKPEGDKK